MGKMTNLEDVNRSSLIHEGLHDTHCIAVKDWDQLTLPTEWQKATYSYI